MLSNNLQKALTVFTENIAMLAIENCLLIPLETIFTGKMVCEMDTEQIVRLASEPDSVQHDREVLQNKVERLQACLKTCSRYDNSSRLLRQQRIVSRQGKLGLSKKGPFKTYLALTDSLAESTSATTLDPSTRHPAIFAAI